MPDLFALVSFIVDIAMMIASVIGLVDCARRSPEAFVAAGKQSKNLWIGLLVASLVVGLLGFGGLGILGLAGVVVVAVYFLDVRPAVASTGGGGRGSSGGGSSGGPYGGW